MPLKELRWPSGQSRHLEGEFVAVGNPDSTLSWDDGDTDVTCSYSCQQSSINNGYRFELQFAPVVRISSTRGRQVDEWIEEFVTPLARLLTLVTRAPQTLSWAMFEHRSKDRQRPAITAQLFGTGFAQEPYVSEDATAWLKGETRPLLDLASTGLNLRKLLQSWHDLDDCDNPFVELYRLTMFQQSLPQRAQFLYMVQALEALHSYEHREQESIAEGIYRAHRVEILGRLEASVRQPTT